MTDELSEMRVALLVAPSVDQNQVLTTLRALARSGALALVVAHRHRSVMSNDGDHHSSSQFLVDCPLDEVEPDDFDAVVVPGEDIPETLRHDEEAMAFLRAMIQQGKLVASIGAGTGVLLSTPLPRGRRVTTPLELADEVRDAGADWVDEDVTIDGPLITGRDSHALEPFCAAIVHTLEERAAHGTRR